MWIPEELRFLLDVDPILTPAPFDVLTFDPTLMAWTALAPSGGASLDVDDDGSPVASNVGTLNFGAGLTATDDGGGQVTIDATGGGVGPTGPWLLDDVADSLTDEPMFLADLTDVDGGGPGTATFTSRETLPVPADATITAIAVLSNEARTAGTLTVELTVNGVGSGLTAALDGTNTECDTGTGSVAVVACDEIGVTVTTDGSWTPTTADITVMLQLGASAGGGLTLIDEVELGSDGLIEFTGIPSTFETLMVEGNVRAAQTSGGVLQWVCRFGDGSFDTGSNYAWMRTGTGNASLNDSSGSDTAAVIAAIPSDSEGAGQFASVRLLIPGYADISRHRNAISEYAGIYTSNRRAGQCSGTWRNTADPISRLQFGSNVSGGSLQDLNAGSVLRLYGLV